MTTYGTKTYTDVNGDWHRVDGPAIIYPDGYKEWWDSGKYVRHFLINGEYMVMKDSRSTYRSYPNGFNRHSHKGKFVWPEL